MTRTAGTFIGYNNLAATQSQVFYEDGTDTGIPVSTTKPLPVVTTPMPAVYVTVTRPADTNDYAANDAVADATSSATLASAALGRTATGTGLIVGLTLQNSNAAATHRVEVDLYNASITAKNDNAEATRLAADKLKYIGTITLPALAKKTTNSDQTEASDFTIRIPYQCAGSSTIYFVIRTLDAHTPASASTYTFGFHVVQN